MTDGALSREARTTRPGLAFPGLLLGPFRLVQQLGRGGFAGVWLAEEIHGNVVLRSVAIKVFEREANDDPLRRARILEEARALCRVEHPNVVRFYSLAIDEERGLVGLAMEHVAGTALSEVLYRRSCLPVGEVLAIGAAVASALSAVHNAGLVHRDVKPANVVETGGVHKLIDFGIASAADDPRAASAPQPELGALADFPIEADGGSLATARATNAESSATSLLGAGRSGTIGYMDPRCVATGIPATAASDLYSLGALLFQCISGCVPAAASMPKGGGLSGAVLDGRQRAAPIRELVQTTPNALAALIDQLLAPTLDDRPRSAEVVALQLERIRDELSGSERSLPPEEEGPFRGLERFEEVDEGVYFGRRAEIASALEALRTRGLVALVGPSGSGKSSLARAGVVPAITRGALGRWPSTWRTAIVTPGRDPRSATVAALGDRMGERPPTDPSACADTLISRVQTSGEGLLLFIDQLEELVTVSDGGSRAWTVEFLRQLGDRPIPGIRVLLTARRDLLDPLLGIPGFGVRLARGFVLVEPLSEATWGDVVEHALAAYGYRFEDNELREQVLEDLRPSAEAMPLVQFALAELWRRRDSEARTITRKALRSIGGIGGALERHADGTLAAMTHTAPWKADTVRGVLLALTTPQGTRTTSTLERMASALGPGTEEVVRELEAARLVVNGPSGFTLTHEALLAQWETLRSWVAEAREDRIIAAEIEHDAARWHADPEGVPLLRARRISFAEELLRRAPNSLSSRGDAFVTASRRAAWKSQWWRRGVIALVLAAAAGGTMTYVRAVQVQERIAAEALQKEQASRELAERRTREVQEAQKQIDELLATVVTSEEEQRKIRELQATIAGPTPSVSPSRGRGAPPVRPSPLAASAGPSTSPSPSPARSGEGGVRKQTEWK